MQTRFHNIAQAIAQRTMRNPEQLWRHYCAALSLFLAVILATYWLNAALITNGILAADRIQSNNSQLVLAKGIVRMATDLDMSDVDAVAQFTAALEAFEATHVTTLAQAEQGTFPQTGTIDGLASEFVALAKRVPVAPDTARHQLSLFYESGPLHNGLIQRTTDLAQALQTETAQAMKLQRMFIAAAAIVLMAEAVFVFWPAQYAVQSTIAKMKRQTRVLRQSQARLRQLNGQLAKAANHNQLTGVMTRYQALPIQQIAIEFRRHLFSIGRCGVGSRAKRHGRL